MDVLDALDALDEFEDVEDQEDIDENAPIELNVLEMVENREDPLTLSDQEFCFVNILWNTVLSPY